MSQDPTVCRVCGCNDSQACTWFEVLGDGSSVQRACSWAAPGLCSECVEVDAGDVVDPDQPTLLYDHTGRPLVLR